MTDKEKAKAYDEALALAKRLISNNCTEVEKLCLKCVFPELKESEDERIRKYLIEELKAAKSVGELKFTIPQPTREKCIAYLEKQKEQKHPNGCFTCDEYKKGYEEGRRNGFTAGYNKAMKEVEQKEQKLADDTTFEKWLDDWYQGSKEAGGDVVMSEAEFKNWSRGIRNMYQQKSAEWSEEDERILKGIIGLIDHDQHYGVSNNEMISWLKSLRPHWKPSEDEVRLINTSISFLKDFADKGYENAVECIDWLKSKLNGNTCK